ncbi:MAG: hypothetical protein HFE73_04365 [Firmicutes bacterium]|nr:hypothetical protein [Bacillota bacterium]
MVKRVLKRISVELCIAVVLLSLMLMWIPTTYAATNLTGLTVDGIGASYDGGTWSAEGNTVDGKITAKSGSCGASAESAKLTFTNNLGIDAILSFSYMPSCNGGSVTIDGQSVTSNGSFRREIKTGEMVTIVITSAASDKAVTGISLSDVALLDPNVKINVEFMPSVHGSYTVDGMTTNEPQSPDFMEGKNSYTLDIASMDEGYSFMGWYQDDKCLSTDFPYEFVPERDGEVTAKFACSTDPMLGVGVKHFFDWNEAIAEAQNGNAKIITLLRDCTMDGNYIIPDGVTLLVPFDDAGTCYTTNPGYTTSYVRPSEYRRLTINGTLTVEAGGKISVGAQHGTGSAQVGAISGKYGYIVLSGNSKIDLLDGATLYAYGFISGNGLVEARTGSTVYEYFQIASWRGGNATFSMNGNSEKVFPFSQYYVQNIEVPLKIHKGAIERGYTTIYAGKMYTSTALDFIGTGGLLELKGEGDILIKKYDASRDRLCLDIYGNVDVDQVSVTVKMGFEIKVSSSNYVLPFNNNISINMHKGTLLFKNDTSLLPGCEVVIDEEADLEIAEGKTLFVYDREQWIADNYAAAGNKFISVQAVSAGANKYVRGDKDLVDVKLDVNGSIIVNGDIYTTGNAEKPGGANITSSKGTGQIVFATAINGDRKLYEVTQSGNEVKGYSTIDCTPAQLHNADDTYTQTADAKVGYIYTYHNGRWSAIPIATTGVETYVEPAVYEESKDVTLMIKGVTGAEIYYTMDGTEPTEDSTLYESEINLPGEQGTEVSYTIKAIAFKDGKQIGPVGTYEYTIARPHEHQYTQDWVNDGENHWHVCTAERCDTDNKVDFGPHVEVTVDEVPTTCAEAGKTAGTQCSICQKVMSGREEIPKLPHTYGEWKCSQEPTTEAIGTLSRTCSSCGDVETKELPVLAKDSKVYAHENVKEATCIEDGEDIYTYIEGEQTFTFKVVLSKKGHTLDDWIEEVPAICEDTGVKGHYYCSQCQKNLDEKEQVIEDLTFEALGHDYSFVAGKAATCKVEGTVEHYHCNRCEKNFDKEHKELANITVERLAHQYSQWKCTQEPTTEATGALTKVCSSCKDEQTKALPVLAKDSKAYTYENVKEATCTEDGEDIYTYIEGEQTFTFKVVLPKKGHMLGEWIEETPATCTAEGTVERYHCNRCEKDFDKDYNELTSIVIEKIAHPYGQWKCTQEPTTEAAGTLSRTCNSCKDEQTKELPVLAKGSKAYTYENVKAATCTEDGKDSYTYTIGEQAFIFKVILPKKGHSYQNGSCTVCGERETSGGGALPPISLPDPSTPLVPAPDGSGGNDEPAIDIPDGDTPLGELPLEEVIAKIEASRVSLHSKTAVLKGKKAIRVKMYVPKEIEKLGLDGYEIFRSTKRYSGYGKKPLYTTKNKVYYNTLNLKKGVTYYYKVRGFKWVDGKKIYTQWSLKAWRRV